MKNKRNVFVSVAVGLLAATSSLVEAQCVDRPDLMYCGSTERSGANLYTVAGSFNEVSGCTPTATTQAMLVTRSGSISGNGPAWLAYLNAGGRIITEWNITNDVYNELYATAYPDGAWFGDCSDNAMPSLKLNPDDPFWLENDITPTAADNEACGFDLSGLVESEGANVTALGGLVGTSTVMFARRAQADGTLFLLEADWQDNQPSFTDDSRLFMGALISACSFAPPPPPPPQDVVAVPVNNVMAILGLGSLMALLGAGYARRRRSGK